MELWRLLSSEYKDISMEILIRLDVRSLARFKVVSKYWYGFLSDPSFSKYYSSRRSSITGFFYKSSETYEEKLRYVSIDNKQELIYDPTSCLGFLDFPAILFNSCNGLLHWTSSWDQHFISNPLTQKYVALSWRVPKAEFFACGITCDPLKSLHFEVLVLMKKSNLKLKPMIFSSETMQWSEIKETSIDSHVMVPYHRPRGVYLNGSLHWELKNDTKIFIYDMKRQLDRLIESPTRKEMAEEERFSEPGCLGEYGGQLYYSRVIGTSLCVWVASNPDYDIWVRKHTVDLTPLMRENPGAQPLAFLHCCEGFLLSVKGNVIACRFDDCEAYNVCKVLRNGEDYILPSMFFPFVNSLALFNLSCGRDKFNEAFKVPSTSSNYHEEAIW